MIAGEIEWSARFTPVDAADIEREKLRMRESIRAAKEAEIKRKAEAEKLAKEQAEAERKAIQDANAGWLTVTIKSGVLTHDTELIGSMDPFVKWNYREKEYKTTVHYKGGKKPSWNEVF